MVGSRIVVLFSVWFLSTTPSLAADTTSWVDIRLPDAQIIRAELADTNQKRAIGLMHRRRLPEGTGMLFVMPEQKLVSFWMKNMLFAIDFIFLSEDGTITGVVPNVPAPSIDGHIPSVKGFGRYVLEVQEGTIAAHDLEIGERLLFDLSIGKHTRP